MNYTYALMECFQIWWPSPNIGNQMSFEFGSFLYDHNPFLTVLSCETAPDYSPNGEDNTMQNISVSYISAHFSDLTFYSLRKVCQEIASSCLLFMAKIHIAESS